MGQVVSQAELILRRGEWKRNGHGVVCASGCFDLVHPGHIRLLEQARSLGDVLVVAVQSDASFRKGFVPAKRAAPEIARPIIPAAERMEILAALAAVDYAVEFDAPSPHGFLLRLAPDVFVEGGTARESSLRESESETLGCRIVRFPLEPGYSTARLIERITELRA
ncbi:MAG: adenylyltransferase/cytidyltransferase family protein [Candidatus Acidiferrales bacterium]